MKIKVLILSFFCGFLLVSCNGNSNKGDSSSSVKVMYDNSLDSLLSESVDIYKLLYPEVTMLSSSVPENDALDSLAAGKTDIVIGYRKLSDAQTSALKAKGITAISELLAVDGVALIVNNDNPCSILFVNEIKDIINGKITKWNQLEPSTLSNIEVIMDSKKGGIYNYALDSLASNKSVIIDIKFKNTQADVLDAVKKNKNAIGLVSASLVASDSIVSKLSIEEKAKLLSSPDAPTNIEFTKDVKVLKIREDDKIEAFKPYSAYLYTGEYPLSRKIFATKIALTGSPSDSFYKFLFQNNGQRILVKGGLLPSVNIR